VIEYLARTDEYKNILLRSDDRKGLGIRNDEEELTKEKKVELLIAMHIQNRNPKGHSLVIDKRCIMENIDRLLNGLIEYFLYSRQYCNAYKALCLQKQLMKGIKTEIMEIDVVNKNDRLLFSKPISGYIVIKHKNKLVKMLKIDQEKDCYMTHNTNKVMGISKIPGKEVFFGRLEITPVRMYSDDELWVVDSSLCKIAGYMIEYAGCEDADAAENSTADDRKIQFKRPDNIIVEEIPNTSYKEIQAITRHLIYERIKEAQKRRRDRIIIVVKNEADEEEYVVEYQKMSFIDNVSFEKHPNCFSS
ncbi:hypothetical protein NEAUS05_2702, partial [Nematocida ausubeli]